MPLSFFLVCELLDQCYNLFIDKKSCYGVITKWFARHRSYVDAHDTSLSALLSTLLPDKRTDRVYCIQAPSLERIIGRACLLGASRIAELAQYRQPGSGIDLADCVHRILTVTPSPGYSKKDLVTVEEIDELLHSLASRVRWSSPSIRTSQASLTPTNRTDVEFMYRRLSAVEAKWFTRLILKGYQPLVLDPHLIYQLCDPLLPCVLKVQDDFAIAIATAQVLRRRLLPNAGRRTPREQIMGTVKPQLGIKIGRQPWLKGRSIKHCLDMGHGRMSVEEKIDGEYCQIHIDPSKGDRCLQIFSKSGKDSTEDRVALHGSVLNIPWVAQADSQAGQY
ncbi:DNA ligase 4 [Fusarium flagelliforme]|uniref:DNA ligase 4 n=1 Tax=Fusarium flagelliforme TaxID=2675880 RepID=A0A395MHX7_9HYPO|nr:DNA ligase 4 [Fusarium flagelliforme]